MTKIPEEKANKGDDRRFCQLLDILLFIFSVVGGPLWEARRSRKPRPTLPSEAGDRKNDQGLNKNNAEVARNVALDQQSNSQRPPGPPKKSLLYLFGWLFGRVIVPIIPFIIGAWIRSLENGMGWSAFKPVQLTFALAMFCLFVYVSAERLESEQYKETIQSTYVLAMVLFIALFSYATVKDSQLSAIHHNNTELLLTLTQNNNGESKKMINQQAQEDLIEQINNTNKILLYTSLFLGFLFAALGVVLHYLYEI